MNRIASCLLVACSSAALPLIGCSESNDKITYSQTGPTYAPGEDPTPEGQKKASLKGVRPGTKSSNGKAYPQPGQSTLAPRPYH